MFARERTARKGHAPHLAPGGRPRCLLPPARHPPPATLKVTDITSALAFSKCFSTISNRMSSLYSTTKKKHRHCNLFTHSTVSQIKIRAMIFLSTCHINAPQRNLMAAQPSPHHPQHTCSSSRSKLKPKISIFLFQQISAGPWAGGAADGLASTATPADERRGPHCPTRKSPTHSQNAPKRVSASSVRHRRMPNRA